MQKKTIILLIFFVIDIALFVQCYRHSLGYIALESPLAFFTLTGVLTTAIFGVLGIIAKELYSRK